MSNAQTVQQIQSTPAAREIAVGPAWPSATQAMLLRAALLDGKTACDALAEWKLAAGFGQYSDVDFLSTYLLPCVYGNLVRAGATDPWLGQLAGLHRYHLAQNAARKQALLDVFRLLQASGSQFVCTGGFAFLAAQYLGDLGERPFLDADLIVAPADARRIREAFRVGAWQAATDAPPVAGWRSEGWCGPSGQTLRVHFRWLPKHYPVVGIGHLMRHAQTVEFGGLALRVPDATDLLLQSCVGGRRFEQDSARQFLWVADAVRILQRSSSDIDWQRLLLESRPLCTLFPLREALEYLRAAFEAPVPDAWLAKAWQVHIPEAELRPFYRSVKRLPGFPASRDFGASRLLKKGTGTSRQHRVFVKYGSSLGASPLFQHAGRPWDGYLSAEQAAGRRPSASGMLRYLAWRASLRWRKKGQVATQRASRSSNEPFTPGIAFGQRSR